MFKNKKKVDELNARCVELARKLRDSKTENKELREIRIKTEVNNTRILNENTRLVKIFKEINTLLTSNTYNDKAVLDRKIKELVQTAIRN